MIDIILGGVHKDKRGQIKFFNDFDLKDVRRFYLINNSNLDVIRGWRAHKIEQRWFYPISGSFSFDLVEIDNWEQPDKELNLLNKIICSKDNNILHVPAGFGTAIKALEPDSELLVFGDHPIEHASLDDYTFELDYFVNFRK